MKYTIAIPAFKPFYLKQTIESVLQQSVNNWELVIVNDCSPYDLDSIVSQFHDKRIRYFKNEKNFGALNVVHNWNKCVELSSGEFIMLIGDDDKLLPNCLECYDKVMDMHPDLDVYHGRTLMIDEQDNPVRLQDCRPEFETALSAIWERMIHRQQFIGDYLFNRETLKNHGGFYFLPLAWGSDDISIFRAIGNKGIGNVNEPVFCYRINPYSITSSGSPTIKMQAMKEAKQWLKDFVNQNNPHSLTEVTLQRTILTGLDNYFLKKTANLIACDFAANGYLRVFFWCQLATRYKLPLTLIAYAFVESLKMKRK